VPSLRWLSRLDGRARFALLSAVPLALLGVLFAVWHQGAEREHPIAEHEAELAARLGTVRLSPAALSEGRLTREEARRLDRRLGRLGSPRAGSLTLWNHGREILYATGGMLPASQADVAEALGKGLRGKVSSTSLEAPDGPQVATFVPLRDSPGGRTLAAFEVRRPLAAVVATAEPAPLDGLLPLLGALALAWGPLQLVAYRGVGEASRGPKPLTEAQLDPLTDLPNRATFRDPLERALIAGKRGNERLVVIVMDIDRFKEINDTLGHYNGDLLLKRIGPRLRTVLRDEDTIARLGGDEFAVLRPALPDDGAISAAAERIVRVFEDPFVLGGLSLEVEASLGVAVYPEHGTRVDALLNHADTAMYAAKAGRTGFALYTDEQERGSRRRLALAGELRRAITGDEIVLNFQPKARIATGQVTGVEALARWQHPLEGMIPPSEFVPIAEQTNMLPAFTERILDRALGQLREWHARGFELTMAVNLSTRNLLDAKLVDQIDQVLRRNRVEPRCLELELTEGMLMSDPRRAKEVLCRLKEIGVTVSVDDFGTGYSSLAYLKDLPVDVIKIDKSFVLGIEDDPRNAAIVRSTIDLGRNLGLEVVAEGVETQTVYDELARLGCDYAQGHLLSRPVPPVELIARVSELERARQRDAELAPAPRPRPLRAVPESA
jgi:diguanylate cyclase (GGDEF)-like protein